MNKQIDQVLITLLKVFLFLILKRRKKRIKMLPQMLIRSSSVAMEHNEWLYVFGFAMHILSFKTQKQIDKTDIYNVLVTAR